MIVDTHVHFYDPERPQGIPFPRKDDVLLYRKVMPEHFRDVASPSGVTCVIVVEASRRMEDNVWILDLASSNELIVGFIGGIDPNDSGFKEQLLRLSASPVFRGIRLRQEDLKNLSSSALKNLGMLQDQGLSVDVLAKSDDQKVILKLADLYPDLPIILNHIYDLDINGDIPGRTERSLLRELGSRANIYCKVSAIQERSVNMTELDKIENYRPMLDCLWECFGEDQLVYGSNWPVCDRAGDYDTQFKIVSSYFSEKEFSAYQKFFVGNSQKAYNWAETFKID